MQAEETTPTSIKEKETNWLRSAVSPLHHRAAKQKGLMGIRMVTRSTWLRKGMKFASEFNDTLVVKSQLLKLVKGVISIAGLPNTQRDGLVSSQYFISIGAHATQAGLHSVKGEVLRGESRRRKEKKRKTTQAVKTLPASIKEKRKPRAEAPCIPFTKRNKNEVNGDQEGY
eukprot:1150673-Pelagomonas_calceolata.AAC.1